MSEEAIAAPEGQAVEAAAPEGQAEVATVNQDPWISSVQDADTKAWAESKGLHNGSFENVLGSYRNLEQMMGADKAGRTVTLLGDDATPEQRSEFYTKLGRPEDASGYGIAAPEGGDNAFADAMTGAFHEAGLSKAQADIINGKWEEFSGGMTQAAADAEHMSAVDAEADLRKDWGAAYEKNVGTVNAAAEQLGFTEAQLEGLRQSMGPVEAMKFVHNLGAQIGDDVVISGEAKGSNERTPEQAKQELGELQMNKEFMDAWLNKQHPGHEAAVAKKSALARMVMGEA
ncbi:hypothetical protein N9878_00480 [bacterium]|nr:hypothetical protein [bacterium]